MTSPAIIDERSRHDPDCTVRYGEGDCTCAPAEVWCSQCDQPTTHVVDDIAFCDEHWSLDQWKRNSPAWAGSPERRAKPLHTCNGRRERFDRPVAYHLTTCAACEAEVVLDDVSVHLAGARCARCGEPLRGELAEVADGVVHQPCMLPGEPIA